jgi:hypothetical protein
MNRHGMSLVLATVVQLTFCNGLFRLSATLKLAVQQNRCTYRCIHRQGSKATARNEQLRISVRHLVKLKCRSIVYSNPVDHETFRNSKGLSETDIL